MACLLLASTTISQLNLQVSSHHLDNSVPEQVLTLSGLNSLSGLSIETFFLQLNESLPNGANSNGTVFVPNSSPLTLAIGDASFDISVNGSSVAVATVPDLTLVPGNNTFAINVQSNITAVTALLQLPAYGCGKLPVDIAGINSTYDGQLLPYFTAALQHNSVRTTLDLVPALTRQGLEGVLTGECID